MQHTHTVQNGPPGAYYVRDEATLEPVFSSDDMSAVIAEAERRNAWPVTGTKDGYRASRAKAQSNLQPASPRDTKNTAKAKDRVAKQVAKDTDRILRADILAAKRKMRVSLGSGREIKRLTNYLWEGETVDQMTSGTYGKGTGLLVLTDRRLLFVQDGIMSQTSEDFPMDKVSSIQWTSGMMMGKITIFASGNKSEITNVGKDDGKEIVDKIRHLISATREQAPAATPAAAAVAADPLEQLKKLGELRDAGVLTPEEFDAKKMDLLARM